MFGSVLLHAAALVLAVGVVGGIGLLVWRRGFQSLTVRGPGGFSLDLEAIRRDVAAINHAVNNVPEGAPTLRERIDEHSRQIAAIKTDISHVKETLAAVKETLVAVGRRLEIEQS